MKEITEKGTLDKILGSIPKHRSFETNRIEDIIELKHQLPIGSTSTIQYFGNPLLKTNNKYENKHYLLELLENNQRMDLIIKPKLYKKIFHPDSHQTIITNPYFKLYIIGEDVATELIGDIYSGKPPKKKRIKKENIGIFGFPIHV